MAIWDKTATERVAIIDMGTFVSFNSFQLKGVYTKSRESTHKANFQKIMYCTRVPLVQYYDFLIIYFIHTFSYT